MRHHAITVIERKSSRSAAIAFARRELEDVHGRYTVARPREVAAAVVGFCGGRLPPGCTASRGRPPIEQIDPSRPPGGLPNRWAPAALSSGEQLRARVRRPAAGAVIAELARMGTRGQSCSGGD